MEFFCVSVRNTFFIILLNLLICGSYIFLVNQFGRYDYLYLILTLILFFPVIVQYLFTFIYFLSSLFKDRYENDSIASNVSWTNENAIINRNI